MAKHSIIDIEFLRKHVKIDEAYDDSLLISYAEAALGHATDVTGKSFVRTSVKELLLVRKGCAMLKRSANGNVQIYDTTRKVRVPHSAYDVLDDVIVFDSLYLCEIVDFEIVVEYTTGPKCMDELDPRILQGVWLYVAHAYENRGDMKADWRDSGALAEWKPLRNVRI